MDDIGMTALLTAMYTEQFDIFEKKLAEYRADGKKYVYVAVEGTVSWKRNRCAREALIMIFGKSALQKSTKPLPLIAFALCKDETYIYLRKQRSPFFTVVIDDGKDEFVRKLAAKCGFIVSKFFPQLQQYAPETDGKIPFNSASA